MPIRLKRAYDEAAADDGQRILVERLWPRGVSRETLKLDEWLKTIAPSTELRKWYGHDPDKWDEFQKRYIDELQQQTDEVDALLDKLRSDTTITFVYAARNEHNSAVVLKKYLEEHLAEA